MRLERWLDVLRGDAPAIRGARDIADNYPWASDRDGYTRATSANAAGVGAAADFLASRLR